MEAKHGFSGYFYRESYVFSLLGLTSDLFYLFLQKQQVNREEILLDIGHVSPYQQIQELIAKKEPYDRLWRNVVEFNTLYDTWMNGPLLDVNAENVDEKVRYEINQK